MKVPLALTSEEALCLTYCFLYDTYTLLRRSPPSPTISLHPHWNSPASPLLTLTSCLVRRWPPSPPGYAVKLLVLSTNVSTPSFSAALFDANCTVYDTPSCSDAGIHVDNLTLPLLFPHQRCLLLSETDIMLRPLPSSPSPIPPVPSSPDTIPAFRVLHLLPSTRTTHYHATCFAPLPVLMILPSAVPSSPSLGILPQDAMASVLPSSLSF